MNLARIVSAECSAEGRDTDVFVAGGGPAGLACAIALARKGLQVLVADGMHPPIDKACGEGLMPDALAALDALGIRLPDLGARECSEMRGIRFIDISTDATGQAAFPRDTGRGVERKLLHQLLVGRAAELGVQFAWETVVRGVAGQGSDRSPSTVDTNGGTVRARFIIGADGCQSRIRACAGLDRGRVSSRRIGLRQHFSIAPWTDFVEVYWSARGQAYVTPVAGNEICIAFVSQAKFSGGVAEALSYFPQLQSHLGDALPSGAPRGAVTFSRKLRRVTRGNVALLGDASGSVDAVTGEGLSLCFRQALALADAIHANDLRRYQRAHTAMRRLPHLMASSMLLMDRSPFLRTHAIAALKRFPWLFAKLLAVHIGHASSPWQSSPPAQPRLKVESAVATSCGPLA